MNSLYTPKRPYTGRRLEVYERCKEMAVETAKIIGVSGWYDHGAKVLSAPELSEVRTLWDSMPGHACWTDAFLKWMNNAEETK